MITILKKLRKSLVLSNRFTHYLVYAIGEIILVVIGILIALQINNWNEDRKNLALERELLQNFKTSLKTDLNVEIEPNVAELKKDILNMEHLMETFFNHLPYNDSLNTKLSSLMYSKGFKYEITAYKTYENLGIGIIKNKQLSDSILHLYNMEYPELQYNIGNFSSNLTEFNRPLMRKLFLFKQLEDGLISSKPIETSGLYDNVEFLNVLSIAKLNFTNILLQSTNVETKVKQLISMIDKELIASK